MFHYRAYDLHIESQVACTGLLPARPDSPLGTVTIQVGPVPRDLPKARVRERFHQTEPGSFLLGVDGVGRYLVSEGTRILVDPAPGASPEALRTFLMGPAMGALLFQRGLLPLQASAIETPRGAVLFLGPRGSGKSTLAAAFRRRHYRVLCDGICALAFGPAGEPHVFPAFPHLLAGPGDEGQEDGMDPGRMALGVDYSPRPRPLRTLCGLSFHGAPLIVQKALRGARRRDLLIDSLHSPLYRWGLPEREQLLGTAQALADAIQMREIARPWEVSRVESLVDRLEREWTTRLEDIL